MPQFRSILVAADFSESSQEAFRAAGSLAREDKTRLFVLHVLEPNWVAAGPVYHTQPSVQFVRSDRTPAELEAEARKLRDAYAPAQPFDVEYAVREGEAAPEILRVAAEAHCDLIVLGTHGRKGLDRFLAGSVAEAVLRGAHGTVLAVRAAAQPPHPAEEIRVILCPTDFSERSEAAVQVARSLARDHGARLVLLNVMPIEAFLADAAALALEPRLYREALDDARARLDGPDLKYPVETRFAEGDAAGNILRVAEELGCDLIVLGTHGRTGLRRVLMGSVAEAVLRRATCPLLAVKAAQPAQAPAAEAGPERPADEVVSVH